MKQSSMLGITSTFLSLTLHLLLFLFFLFSPSPIGIEEVAVEKRLLTADFILSNKDIASQEENRIPQNEEKVDSSLTKSTVEKSTSSSFVSENENEEMKVSDIKKTDNRVLPIITRELFSVSSVTSSKDSSVLSEVEEVSFEKVSKGIFLPSPPYPKRAIDEGLEGEVLVELLIARSGNIADITIIKSSGYEILDEVCIRTIEEKWVFNPFDTIRKTTKRFVFSLE